MIRQGYSNIPTDGLIASWDGDGDWKSKVSSVNDGTPFNIVYEPAEKGFTAEQSVFNGTTSYVTYPATGLPTGSANRGISIWYKPTSLVSTYQHMFMYGPTVNHQLFDIIVTDANIGVGILGANIFYNVSLTDGKWHMITCELDGTTLNDINIYIDKVLLTSIASSVNPTTTVNTTLSTGYIGQYAGGGSFANGVIDLIRFYDRKTTVSDRENLWWEGIRKFGTRAVYPELFQDCVMYYDFKGDAKDVIGGYDLTVTGATLTTDHLGNSNNAYLFNANTEKLQRIMPAQSSLNYPKTTIIGYKRNSEITTSFDYIYRMGNNIGGSLLNFDLYYSYNGGSIKLQAAYGSVYGKIDAISYATLGTDYHIIGVTTNGTSNLKLYTDGVEQVSATGTATTQSNSIDDLVIGNNYSGGFNADGYIDFFLHLKREVSASEMATLSKLLNKNYIYPYTREMTPNLTDGLVLWVGDSAGTDYSGNGNNGTPTNITKLRRNQSEGGSYNGSTSDINFSSSIIPSGAKSITFTFKTTMTGVGYICGDCQVSAVANGVVCFVNTSFIRFYVVDGSGTATVLAIGTTNIADGELHTVTATWDGTTGTDKAIIYLDGKLETTYSPTKTTETTPDDNLRIGRQVFNGNYQFNGELYDVKVRNRNMTQFEAQQDYYLNFLKFN